MTRKKHILGMAKSSLNLKGGKGPKLELDFLRLVYAVQHLRARGDYAKGYLLVMTEDIRKRAKSWIGKYEAGDTIVIDIPPPLPPDKQEALEAEKKRNAGAINPGSPGDAVAVLGKQLGEDALRKLIELYEPEVREVKNESAFPDIRWDFYGQV